MRFDSALERDIPALAALWQEAFDENAGELIGLLLEMGQGFCCREGETITAMAFALPYAVASEGDILDGRYLYGVATAKAYRGQGIATELMKCAETELAKQGADGLLLMPANDTLRAFYKQRGFRNWSAAAEREKGEETPCGAEEYLRLREGYLADTAHIFPPKELIERCRFYKSENGCRAELFGKTAETLPARENGRPYAMAKPLTARFPEHGFFSFAMDE